MAEYLIYEENIERLEKKLGRIRNKCEKYGYEFTYNRLGEEFVSRKDEEGIEKTYRYIKVEAEGHALINGWEFVATLDHAEAGNIIRGYLDGVEIPKRYYSCSPACEHCNSKRTRKNTYIVRNIESGEFKQVGKSCLNDYTHGLNADEVAQYISWFDELIKGEEPYGSTGFGKAYYETKTMACIYAECTKKFGYFNRDSERPTASRGFDYYSALYESGRLHSKVLAKYREEIDEVKFNPDSQEGYVEEVFKWVEEQEDDSNYLHNLKVIVAQDYITSKEFGFLASAFYSYDKAMDRLAKIEAKKNERKDSEYIGEVGQRITFKVDSARIVTSFFNQFGTTFLYEFISEGNVIMWYGSRGYDTDKIESVTGTIKEYKEFNGIKQTVVTRCKVAEKKEEKVETTGKAFDVSVFDVFYA